NESCFMDMSVDCCLTLIMSILCFDGNKSEFPKGETNKQLNRLARLERDIVLHELTEKEILERIQDEFVGQFAGDWMESRLKDFREKSSILIELTEKVDDVLAEVNKIDSEYIKEKKGRIEEYVEELDKRHVSYSEILNPLLDWLKDARIQAALHKDEYIESLVQTSHEELKARNLEVSTNVSDATKKLRGWLKSHP
ncbi:hypothetical protein BOW50_12345, partial [Solemya velum gill symbiont]|uniref:hypothetical protein n=1 Tax=Solemya velum gill symbiont TaxID=2340 RepID=UPI0009C92EA9